VIELANGKKIEIDEFNFEDIAETYTSTWEYAGWKDPLGQAVGTIINEISSFFSPILNDIKYVIDSVLSGVDWLKSAVSSISTSVDSILARVENVASAISGIVIDVEERVRAIISPLISGIASTVSNILYRLESLSSQIPALIDGAVVRIIGYVENLPSMIAGVEQRVAELFGWFERIIGELGSVRGIITRVISEIANIGTRLGEIIGKIEGIAGEIVVRIRSAISPIIANIGVRIEGITRTLLILAGDVRGVLAKIGEIPAKIRELGVAVASYLRPLYVTVSHVLAEVTRIPQVVKTELSGIGRIVLKAIYPAFRSLETIVRSVLTEVTKIPGKLISGVIDLGKKIEDFLRHVGDVMKTFRLWFSSISDGLDRVATAFKGFVNPLVGIEKWLSSKFEEVYKKYVYPIAEAIKSIRLPDVGSVIKAIESELASAKSAIEHGWSEVTSWLSDRIVDMAKGVIEYFKNRLKDLMEFGTALFGGIIESFADKGKEFVLNVFVAPTMTLIGAENFVKEHSECLYPFGFSSPRSRLQDALNTLAEILIIGNLPIEIASIYAIVSNFDAITAMFKKIEAQLGGIIAKLGIEADVESVKKGFAKTLKVIAKEFLKTIIFTTAFWIYEPYKFFVNPFVRWNFGGFHEIPTYSEIVRSTRRFLPCAILGGDYKAMFDSMVKHLHEIMDMRGFPFWFEAITLGEHAPKPVLDRAGVKGSFFFEIRDRFNTVRQIPLIELYEIPTPSDTVRMMLRDVIQNLDDFEKIMLMHGFNRDITAMYYLLHFRYPSPTSLFEFVCRVAGGVVWFSPTGVAERIIGTEIRNFTKWGLGFPPKSPVDLKNEVEKIALPAPSQTASRIDTSKIDEAVMKRFSQIVGYVLPYYKWHDYFPMAWINGFTSDQQIAIELSADIPQRIDARWMFKWAIISDQDLLRIVIARGMHPLWASKITIAEVMNALSEERTVARTGVMNAYRHGFMLESTLMNVLSNITTIKVLGVDVPVRFLEGEVKLLTIRAKYDRAIEILRDTFGRCVRAYALNIYDMSTFVSKLEAVTNKLAETLKLPLSLDATYFEALKPYLDIYHEIDTVERVRSWIRYSMYQLLYRFMRGFVPKDSVNKLVDILVSAGKLTDEEKSVFLTLMDFMSSAYVQEVKVNAVLRKLSRGAISLEEARRELTSLSKRHR